MAFIVGWRFLRLRSIDPHWGGRWFLVVGWIFLLEMVWVVVGYLEFGRFGCSSPNPELNEAWWHTTWSLPPRGLLPSLDWEALRDCDEWELQINNLSIILCDLGSKSTICVILCDFCPNRRLRVWFVCVFYFLFLCKKLWIFEGWFVYNEKVKCSNWER